MRMKAKEVEATLQVAQKVDGFKIFLVILYAVSLAIYAYFVYQGLDFYRTTAMERPHHEAYRTLRPAGFVGHGFGIIGTLMMLFMLLYSVRKRTRIFGEWGSLSRWLDIHIYFGIMGPLFIILHTAFKVQGLVAVSFWSMIAVATSGVLGRFLYQQIPRNRMGGELTLKDINKLNEQFTEQLQEELNLNEDQLIRLQEYPAFLVDPNQSIFKLFLMLFLQDWFKPFFRFRIKRRLSRVFHLKGKHLKNATEIALKKMVLQRRLLALDRVESFFHYWHVLHKPFAILMYVIMIIHVGVAVWLGYTWVF
ncbi:MAG: hypothetical protein D6748_09880 [Calditrichaeota bacterium]|nr:MAG: hypothetical protein D6748_09880 [Calditrichota bacterium]